MYPSNSVYKVIEKGTIGSHLAKTFERYGPQKKLAFALGYLELEEEFISHKKRKNRAIWEREWISKRPKLGMCHTLMKELAVSDRPNYKKWIRMDAETFEVLVNYVSSLISKQNTIMRESITAAERLALTLRYLATGESMTSLQFQFRIGLSTISEIIPETCSALYEVLKDEFLKVPKSLEDWKEIEEEFSQRWNFPNCIGSLDGKHVGFVAPRDSGSFYQNYKGTKSIVFMALVDANYRFIYVDVGTNGRVSDGGVWNKTNFKKRLDSNTLGVPGPKALPGTNSVLPHVIVADEAFGLKDYLLKPYAAKELDDSKRIFNYRLSRARRIVENAFGILANRWLIFQSPIKLDADKVELIVLACCALHNFLNLTKGQLYIPTESVDQEDIETGDIREADWRSEPEPKGLLNITKSSKGKRYTDSAKSIRDEFKSYFNTIGQVPFQWKNIYE